MSDKIIRMPSAQLTDEDLDLAEEYCRRMAVTYREMGAVARADRMVQIADQIERARAVDRSFAERLPETITGADD